MSLRRESLRLAAAAVTVILIALPVAAQTSPEAFLGHKVGADRKLADYRPDPGLFQEAGRRNRPSSSS